MSIRGLSRLSRKSRDRDQFWVNDEFAPSMNEFLQSNWVDDLMQYRELGFDMSNTSPFDNTQSEYIQQRFDQNTQKILKQATDNMIINESKEEMKVSFAVPDIENDLEEEKYDPDDEEGNSFEDLIYRDNTKSIHWLSNSSRSTVQSDEISECTKLLIKDQVSKYFGTAERAHILSQRNLSKSSDSLSRQDHLAEDHTSKTSKEYKEFSSSTKSFVKSYVNRLFEVDVLPKKFDFELRKKQNSSKSLQNDNSDPSIIINSPQKALSDVDDKNMSRNTSSIEWENLSNSVKSMIKAEVRRYMDIPNISESSVHDNISDCTSRQYDNIDYEQKSFLVYYVDDLLNKSSIKAINLLKEEQENMDYFINSKNSYVSNLEEVMIDNASAFEKSDADKLFSDLDNNEANNSEEKQSSTKNLIIDHQNSSKNESEILDSSHGNSKNDNTQEENEDLENTKQDYENPSNYKYDIDSQATDVYNMNDEEYLAYLNKANDNSEAEAENHEINDSTDQKNSI